VRQYSRVVDVGVKWCMGGVAEMFGAGGCARVADTNAGELREGGSCSPDQEESDLNEGFHSCCQDSAVG
jgi:hypothetical protein